MTNRVQGAMSRGTAFGRRPHTWMMIEGIIVVSIYLMVVTVSWANDLGSPWRLGLVLVSWGSVVFMVARGIVAKRGKRRSA